MLYCFSDVEVGIRIREVERIALHRKFDDVQTKHGNVAVKVAGANGKVYNIHPEYQDCKAIARLCFI